MMEVKCLGACRNCGPRKPKFPGSGAGSNALNEVARVRAEQDDAQAFRLMQAQAMVVGQRRIELSMRIAELERIGGEPEVTACVTQNGAFPSGGSPRPGVREGFRCIRASSLQP